MSEKENEEGDPKESSEAPSKASLLPAENADGKVSSEMRMLLAQKIQIGPIPPAEELEHLDRVVPGSAEKIINNMLEYGQHRREGEAKQQTHDHRQETGGFRTMAAIAAVVAVLLVVAVLRDSPFAIAWLVIALGAIIGAGPAFRILGAGGDSDRRKEDEQ